MPRRAFLSRRDGAFQPRAGPNASNDEGKPLVREAGDVCLTSGRITPESQESSPAPDLTASRRCSSSRHSL
jgi:hypothetical protein